jgi:hypothetical protein
VTIEVVDGRLLPSRESGDEGRLVIDLRIKVSCAADCRPVITQTGTTSP